MSLLCHLDSLSADYFDRTPVGELLYPFEGPIDEISYFGSDLLPSILRAVIAAGITLSAMAVLSSVLTLIVIPIVPAFLILRHRYRTKIGQEADLVQATKSKFTCFLQEHLSGLIQIQLLGQTESRERQACQLLANTISSQDALWQTGVFFSALINLAIVTGIALTLTGGSLMVFRGALTTGTLVAFYSLLVQLFEPLSMAMETYSRAQRTFASVRQIKSFLEVSPTLKERYSAKPLPFDRPLDIALRHVFFSYGPEKGVVQIPQLGIAQGERIAIVGPNGAGKSTLAKLLARLYDVEAGEIKIAGLDVRAVKLDSLRSAVCYLPAQPILFHLTLADNLRLGRSESRNAELERVLRCVDLTKYLDGFPNSLEQYIEPGGSNLSNGERQRVAIARALLCGPRILILDETSCSLDPTSEETMLRMLDRALPNSTLIVVSHRLHSIGWMERFLVMQRGRIVGDGKPSTLGATNSLYAGLLASTAPNV
jgi:ABC-type multidrug transport system fused ATPase/permease subunit